MGTVTIPTPGGSVFDIYGTQAAAVIYLTGSFSPAATAWLAFTADQKAQTLVAATRMLDLQNWQGEPVAAYPVPQTLKWPRTGVLRFDGTPVSSATVPPEIENGSYELAALLGATPAMQEQQDQTTNIRSLQAGSASIEYFRPVNGGKFPPSVQSLVAQFLAGGLVGVSANSSGAFSQAFGTQEPSEFTTDAGYDLTRSF